MEDFHEDIIPNQTRAESIQIKLIKQALSDIEYLIAKLQLAKRSLEDGRPTGMLTSECTYVSSKVDKMIYTLQVIEEISRK